MPEKKSLPRADPSIVQFPTDKVTMGQLRKEQPELFADGSTLRDEGINTLNISATYATELQVFEKAYAKASGLPEPYADESRRSLIGWLNDDYKRYGLSSGIHETTELVKAFEKAAQMQAKARGPKR